MPSDREKLNAERRSASELHLGALRGGRLDVERIPEPLKTINALVTSAAVIIGEALGKARDSGQHPDIVAYIDMARAACNETRLLIVQRVNARGGDQRQHGS